MKGLLILAAVVLLAALLGWLSFGNSDDSATMTIDKQEVRQDTEAAVEKAKEVAEEAKQKIQEAVGEDQPADSPDEPAAIPRPSGS